MWESIVSFVKGLFGSKGTTQIGRGNQAVTGGSAAGANSPVMTAGRDIHFNAPTGPTTDPDAEMFADLEQTMPDVLKNLRENLAEHPLIRVIIVMDKKSLLYNWPDDHLRFTAEEDPDIRSKVQILENHGLLRHERGRDFAYRMTERFVKYLRKK